MRDRIRKLMGTKTEGLGVIEIILIIVVLIGLVLLFKTQITALINNIIDMISERVKGL